MEFLIAAHSDVGIKKHTNQDSLMVKVVDTDYGKVCFALVCDGMGGLSKGELASASLIRIFSRWFEEEFPEILYKGIQAEVLKKNWEQLVYEANFRIGSYSTQNQVKMGTTIVAMLFVGNVYYVLNVGDSRAYELTASVRQITKDQTVIQREMDLGRMTPEEAKRDPRRNMLLQCVGASNVIDPDFFMGEIHNGSNFLLCSDGFRHVIGPEEILEKLGPTASRTEQEMMENVRFMIELNKYRHEEDNISAVLIRVS